MKPLKIKNIEFNTGKPKIAVPIMFHNPSEIEEIFHHLKGYPYDVVEWRVDYLDDLSNETLLKSLEFIHQYLTKGLLLVTYRTVNQGGNKEISEQDYIDILTTLIESKQVDLIDIEYICVDKDTLIKLAHKNKVHVILSDHHFDHTPKYKLIKKNIKVMSKTHADIVKVAYMPSNYSDVLNVMKATYKMRDKIKQPIISMSMSDIGKSSRVLSEMYGSVLTFGCVNESSAPGQIDAKNLNQILNKLHNM